MRKALVLVFIILGIAQSRAQPIATNTGDSSSSSGWVPIHITAGRVLFTVVVNGRQATANIVNSVQSQVDGNFVDNNNIQVTAQASGQPSLASLTVQIGALSISKPINAQVSRRPASSPPIDVVLGDELFNEFIVDIDFPNQRMALHKAGTFKTPKQATSLQFKLAGDSRAIPVSVEHGPEMLYWVYLGDPAPVSVYQNYSSAHGLLTGRANSVRIGGGKRTPPEAIATIKEMLVAGTEFKRVPCVLPDDSITGQHPDEVAGHIGLAILSRGHVIFDYSHDKLYIIAGSKSATTAPFATDRSGLFMQKVKDEYIVKYVSPGSPALTAGFKVGDIVTQINGQPMPAFLGTAWQTPAWGNVQLTDTGTTYTFTLKDNTVRKLTTAVFF